MAEWIRVYASRLDCSGPNLFWAVPPSEELIGSLREMGQLEPVLVRARADQDVHDVHAAQGGGYVLLSGYQRVAALAEEGREIVAGCLSGSGSALEDGLIYLHANLHRPLNESMRIKALRYFQPLLSQEELGRRVAVPLGLPPRSGTWRKYLDWLALPASWDDLLHRGNIPLAAGKILAGLGQGELEALRPYFSAWKWSQSRAVQWLAMLKEVALQRGWSVNEILEAASAPMILQADLAPQDALQRLAGQTRSLRFPHLERMERRFAALAKELFGASRWEITPSPHFESDTLELRLRAQSPEALQTAAHALDQALRMGSKADNPKKSLAGLFRIGWEEEEQSGP
ncbi:hypothetical protein [Desulfonatronum thioautotrophicum]|uniref:hypothetical protein n=1 Tax=Desulfonatronum thioautotrophicum TaxID=617001 RepID=UPI0005EB3B85|nr:hypothetical protein [Desulfonatronum thioautotrophicum]